MRHLTAVVVLSAAVIAIVSRARLWAVDERPSAPSSEKRPENPRRTPKTSDNAVVQDIVYGLEEDSNRLCLTSQPLNGDDRELKRVELKFVIPPRGDIEPDEEQEVGTLTEGIFYFNGCPLPPSDGALSPFRVKSVPPKGAGE